MSARPYDEAAVFVVTPDIVRVRTSEKLIGLIGVVENEVRARQLFYYRKEGARAAL
jgi:septum formation inhibitor-activating ATPase MinD